MKVTSDPARYEVCQAELAEKIADVVRNHLRLVFEGRIKPDLSEVTNDIVFSVTSILDGAEEEPIGSLIPMITFATSDARDELIIGDPGEGSWLHEYAHG